MTIVDLPPARLGRGLALLAAGLLALLPACRQPPPPPFQPTEYETPAATAVLRQVLGDAIAAGSAAQVGIIVLGPQLEDSTPAFREPFADTGLRWFSAKDMTNVWVGPVARVIEKSTKLQPLQLQLFSVESRPDGAQDIVAAWAFEDKMVRRRYLATPAATGEGWTVQPLEIVEEKKGAPTPAPAADQP